MSHLKEAHATSGHNVGTCVEREIQHLLARCNGSTREAIRNIAPSMARDGAPVTIRSPTVAPLTNIC